MKKNKGLLILSIFIIVIIFSVLLSNLEIAQNKGLAPISISDYLTMVNEENLNIIYIGDPNCPYCEMIEPILINLEKELDIKIHHLNYSSLNGEEQSVLLNSHDLFKGQWGMPLLLIFEKGVLIDHHIGYAEHSTIKQFLSFDKLSNGTQELNEISVEKYLDEIKNEEKVYVYVGTPTCPYCQMIEPVLKELENNLNISFNYLNYNNLTQSERQNFVDSHDFLKGQWGMPLLLIFEKGSLVDHHIGYAEYTVIEQFLK